MLQLYPDEGLVEQLLAIMLDDKHYHLFVNDITPDRSTELADLTEAAWTGYAAQTVAQADWATTGVAGHVGFIQAPPVVFDNSSGVSQDAYGYYVTNDTDDMLFAVARFDGAPVSRADGDTFVVVPVWGDSSSLD